MQHKLCFLCVWHARYVFYLDHLRYMLFKKSSEGLNERKNDRIEAISYPSLDSRLRLLVR